MCVFKGTDLETPIIISTVQFCTHGQIHSSVHEITRSSKLYQEKKKEKTKSMVRLKLVKNWAYP